MVYTAQSTPESMHVKKIKSHWKLIICLYWEKYLQKQPLINSNLTQHRPLASIQFLLQSSLMVDILRPWRIETTAYGGDSILCHFSIPDCFQFLSVFTALWFWHSLWSESLLWRILLSSSPIHHTPLHKTLCCSSRAKHCDGLQTCWKAMFYVPYFTAESWCPL